MPKDLDFTDDIKIVTKSIEEVGKAFEEFKTTNDENQTKHDALWDEKLTKIGESIDAHQAKIDEFELAQKRKNRTFTDEKGNVIDHDAVAKKWMGHAAKWRGAIPEASWDAENMAEYKSAFSQYMRKDDKVLSADETKALSVGSDVDGGYLVSPDTSGRIVNKVFESSDMRAHASIQVISTDALEGLYDLDEAAGGWVSETGTRNVTDTPELGTWRIPVHELSAMPKATQRLLDDSEIDSEGWLADKVAQKFARMEATAFVTGDGNGKPRGFLDYADGTTLPGTIERIASGANGAFVAAPNGADCMINALYALKNPYMMRAMWYMARSTLKEVRKLKDSDGAYIWQPSLQAGQPSTILGYGAATMEDMPSLATDSLSIAVGDMAETYQIVDRVGIRVLRDPYSSKPYVLFYTTKRTGGDVTNFESMKLIEFTS